MIGTLLDIPLAAWTSVVIAYVYVSHGPGATTASAPAMAEPGWPDHPPEPGMAPPAGPAASMGPSRFCASCGAPLRADAKFCVSCGKPV